MAVSTRALLLGVAVICVAVFLLFRASRGPDAAPLQPVVVSAAGAMTGAPLLTSAPNDWTDLLDLPYDEAVSVLRRKYQESFPVMVVREGAGETMPVEPEAMYFWVDGDGIVRSYSFDEQDTRVITHGGIVRRYDSTA